MQEIKQLGNRGEELTAQWLQKQGFTILEKNYRSRWGEIDIIAVQHDLMVFVEVKTRKTAYFPIATVVNKSKQKKLIKTAHYFVATKNVYDKALRFDIATIISSDHGSYEIEYLKNAFAPEHY